MISSARDLLSTYYTNEDMINVGAYVKNSNPKIDRSIEKFPLFENFLKQNYEQLLPREDAFSNLLSLLQ